MKKDISISLPETKIIMKSLILYLSSNKEDLGDDYSVTKELVTKIVNLSRNFKSEEDIQRECPNKFVSQSLNNREEV